MKAVELIEHLQHLIEKEGQDVEVFTIAGGYYCSQGIEDMYPPIYDPEKEIWHISESYQSW